MVRKSFFFNFLPETAIYFFGIDTWRTDIWKIVYRSFIIFVTGLMRSCQKFLLNHNE